MPDGVITVPGEPRSGGRLRAQPRTHHLWQKLSYRMSGSRCSTLCGAVGSPVMFM